jgi:hypothetical protein
MQCHCRLRRSTRLTVPLVGATRTSTCIAPLVVGNSRGLSASARQPCRQTLPNDVPTGQTFRGGSAAALMRIGLFAGCSSKRIPGEMRLKSANSAPDGCLPFGPPPHDAIRLTMAAHSAETPIPTVRLNVGTYDAGDSCGPQSRFPAANARLPGSRSTLAPRPRSSVDRAAVVPKPLSNSRTAWIVGNGVSMFPLLAHS